MSRYNRQRKISKKEYVYRISGLIAMIVILTVFLPKGGYSKYEYKVGEPWDGSQLIAQDSFPVYKSDAQLKRESDSLRNYYEPYFEYKDIVYEKQAAQMKDALKSMVGEGIPFYYLPHLLEKLRYR